MASEPPKIGLRERKKMKTREAIQQHAIRLFREQGYHETTIEQIAEAAEISPSTFFRYFPTKEALVLEDDYDPLLIEAFQQQPPGLSPIQAMREAIKIGFSNIPEDVRKSIRERMELTMTVPEVRAATLNQLMGTMEMLARLISERIRRSPDDLYVLTLAGSVMGAFMSVQVHAMNRPDADYLDLLDHALSHLESGFSLDAQ